MDHPVAVVGAGPIGLAAAAHAAQRGLPYVVLEAGPAAGAAVAEWSHVRLFSAWRELVDPVARELLEASGWQAPDLDAYPTGAEWRARYLEPLAALLDARPGGEVRYDARVEAVTRAGRDLVVDPGRAETPFAVHARVGSRHERLLAGAVVDASGTWSRPNPLGSDGHPAPGEVEHGASFTRGVPDLADPVTAGRFAGRHVAVAGKGATALGTLVGLVDLARREPGTRVSWLLRRPGVGDAFGGGEADQLAERGALGTRAREAVGTGVVATRTGFRTVAVEPQQDGRLSLVSADGQRVTDVDEVVVATGFRPDLSFLSEVRLDLDPALQSARGLAEQIHPDHHSCGDVAPHGHRELAQPEAGLYLVGMKSYGRAPSFLAMTGFEQVRSVVAALAGDLEAADRVELVLPETGVCDGAGRFDTVSAPGDAGCCGEPGSLELSLRGAGEVVP